MEPDFQAYLVVMEEIKKRIELIKDLGTGKVLLNYKFTHVESMVLQLRMILELISLGSLAANKEIFETYKKKFDTEWRVSKILKALESLNPNFFPTPLIESSSNVEGVKNELIKMTEDFITISELSDLHGRCGGLLHARNPYAKQVDYDFFENSMAIFVSKIINLLSTHKIQLLDDDKFYLVHMVGSKDSRSTMYTFQKIDS